MKIVTLPGTSSCTRERTLELELEHADAPVVARSARSRSAASRSACPRRTATYSRNSSVVDPARELLVGEEPVLAAVHLARALRARRRRDGDLELGHALEQRLDQRALAGTRRAGDDEDGPR